VPDQALIIGFVMVIALGIISGAMPALAAVRLRTAEALRRNG